MVCVPCIIIPVLLYIWHRFIQPIVMKFWNPWKPVENAEKKTDESTAVTETKATCPFSNSSKTSPHPEPIDASNETTADSKKNE